MESEVTSYMRFFNLTKISISILPVGPEEWQKSRYNIDLNENIFLRCFYIRLLGILIGSYRLKRSEQLK